ncbi:MAG: hypothetical protein CM1200mP22_00390 [Dehalococcoidia bacterium]|nr:MAG: hypothetical protein CM1200mP22_00390 [Dehalococcoidia bacterium]
MAKLFCWKRCGLISDCCCRLIPEVGKDESTLDWIWASRGKITNALLGMNRRVYSGIAINTEEADLSGLGENSRKDLDWKKCLRGRGVGSDIDLGASIAEKSLAQMMDSIDAMVRKRDPKSYGFPLVWAGVRELGAALFGE